MEAEKDYFYCRNRQGIMERYHVSEWRNFIEREYYPDNGRSREQTSSPGENTGEPVSETGGESSGEAANRPVRAVEKEDYPNEPFSTVTTPSY